MLILFDQGTPVPIRQHLAGHDVRTAAQQGWDKLKNGELLTAAEEAGFELLLTTDKNMRHQQNLANRKIAVVVLGLQQWPSLRPHVQRVIEAVNAAIPGSYNRNRLSTKSRTRKLSPAGPIVLHAKVCGRVGRCRHK